MSKKTNKNSFEVADSNRTPYTIKLLFQCKDKKKTQVMIQKDRSRKIEILAYWGAQLFIHIPLGLNKRQEFNSKTVFTTLENQKALNCRILAAKLKPFFNDVFILFFNFIFIFCNFRVF